MTDVKTDNHYVPQFYLDGWSDGNGRVWTYPVLVSHESVPQWRKRSVKGIAYHQHLYTRMVGEAEVDDIERWLEKEFETPGREVVEKVRQDKRLSTADWRALARYVAAQDVRTPASFVRSMQRWDNEVPTLLQSALENAVAELEQQGPDKGHSNETPALETHTELRRQFSEMVPTRLVTETAPGSDSGFLRLEMTVGRSLWLYQIRHLLSGTYRVLQQNRWKIVRAPEGVEWLSTDDPVLKLNYNGPNDYDFGGGWGKRGTDILVPLSPKHLLYTEVGLRARQLQFPLHMAKHIQRFIAEHAHRYIFAREPLAEMNQLRPRVVDAAAFKGEREAWKRWHAQQSEAETGDHLR